MSATMSKAARVAQAAQRLQRVIARLESAAAELSCGQISSGKGDLDRALAELKDLAADESGRALLRGSSR